MDVSLVAANIILVLTLFVGAVLTLFGLPGNFVILVAAAGYGWFEGFVHFNMAFLLFLGGLFLLGEAVEFGAGALGAKRARASGLAMVAACLGGVAGAVTGTLVLPLFGTVIGTVAGAFAASYLAEYGKTGSAAKAGQVARSAAVGLLIGTLFKLAVAVGMVSATLIRLFTEL
jgi:uncharacterized protein YqgC (DUF456 family)